LAAKQKAAENRSERLQNYVKYCMETAGKDKLKGELLSFRLQNNPPKMVIESEAFIPKKFYRVERVLDKETLKKVIQGGKKYPGVSIIQEKGLRIS